MRLNIAVVLCILVLFLGCSNDSTSSDNESPTLMITNPVDTDVIEMGTIVNIIVEADDNEAVDNVTFFIDFTNIFEDDSEPYIYSWDTSELDGSHTIYAKAEDSSGNVTSCESISVEITRYGTVTDFDGNVYQTIVIGDQVWMAENLKVTHFRNGDAIPNITDEEDWTDTYDVAYCVYENYEPAAQTLGNLYNWYAVDDARGLAPEGWHVPSDEELMELEMYLGMSLEEAQSTGERGTNEGSKLAGFAELWEAGNLVNDSQFGSSGFNLIPAGCRDYNWNNFTFFDLSYSTRLWTSSQYTNHSAWVRFVGHYESTIARYTTNTQKGYSVRCVRDE